MYLDIEFLMTERHVDALNNMLHDAFAHSQQVHLEATQHRAVYRDGDFLQLVVDFCALELALLVAHSQHIVYLHIMEA